MVRRFTAVASLLTLAGCASVTEVACDWDAVVEALARAAPGDTVYVGACTIEGGSLLVPPGVNLQGFTTETTVFVLSGELLVLGAPDGCSSVRRMTVVSEERIGISGRGPGGVCIEDVRVEAELGRGISGEHLSRFEVRRVVLRGPVTPSNADSEPLEPDDETAATYGLMMLCVEDAVLEDVDARGFSYAGVAASDTILSWSSGFAGDGLGSAVLIHASEAEIANVEISGVLQGTRLIPPYGLVADQSRVATSGLYVHDSGGYGALYNGGASVQDDAIFEGMDEAGSWVQLGALEVRRSLYADNHLAGIASYGAGDLRIEETSILRTALRTRIVSTMPVDVGSGLLIQSRHDGALVLSDVHLEDNADWGALLLLQEGFDHSVSFEGVTVLPAGRGFGVLGGPLPAGWQTGITPPEATSETPVGSDYGWPSVSVDAGLVPPLPPACS